ncbi:MAG: hypothetical protein GX452_10570 [Ignavibacteriales bacterium]|jgi:hypothetical protein|nr:hypothetical protein [Ignavibacteriaceae bacterium]NLH61835.1 hypothetical protein [Ignavibacteriales bacterium]
MKKCIFSVAVFLFAVQMLFAQDPPKTELKFNGVYNAWGQMQNDFTMGKSEYRDHYFVQMFRLNFSFNYGENIKAITRFDLGQGWWGVDNEPPTYNGASGAFDNKDAHYILHVDQAYIWFNVPSIYAAFNVGRFNWSAGNKLVLDNNYDGILANIKVGKDDAVKLGFAKISEGVLSISDLARVGMDSKGNYDASDANLFTGAWTTKFGATNLELFGMYYKDASFEDSVAYLIDGLYYNRPRFTPQVTQLTVLGAAGTTKYDKLTFNYEANYLMGKDEIDNKTFAGRLNTASNGMDALKYDKNNGDLMGYNAYLKVDYAATDALTVGLVAGMGSGDDDPTQGKGNVNKLRTAGFFYLTELWEDSIMPDEEGITPQGLGAPNVRAYRELENTTALQINGTVSLTPQWKLFGSFTYLKATQPVYAWTNSGPDLTKSATDLGWEVDLKTDYKIYSNLTFTFRAGYLSPGVATKYLINGSDKWELAPWELKSEITFVF